MRWPPGTGRLIVQVDGAKGVAPARRGRRRTHLRTGILLMSPAVLGAIAVGAWIMPDVVAGFLWYACLAGGPQSIAPPGLLNSIVSTFGLPQHAWLQEYPMAAVIVANTWRGTAFSMLLYASALEGIPPELYEAASIDGAGIWARVRRITLPLLTGTIATDLV